jgi:hypothetical protein
MATAFHIILVVFLLEISTPGCAQKSLPATPVSPVDTLRHSDTSVYSSSRQCGTIANPAVTEASGIAASRLNDAVLWIHNDSGDEPRLFAIDTTGTTLAVVHIDNASAVDWEDIASVTIDGIAWIYIADVGDNAENRSFISVYRILEPRVNLLSKDSAFHAVATENRFAYPDGAHNCEALAVHPGTGALYLVTKTEDSVCQVFKGEWKENPAGTQTLKKIAELRLPYSPGPLRLVTAADISPDGTRALLRTYLTALEFQTSSATSGDALWLAAPRMVEMPAMIQAEAVCYSRNGNAIYTTTEGINAPLWVIRK